MLIPAALYFVIFHYLPMAGLVIGFKDYSITRGILESPWVGFGHFRHFFFQNPFSYRLIRNTVMINLYQLIFFFPAPIILALLLNEVRHSGFKRVVQTVTYLPHFISAVVVVGIVLDFVATSGIINDVLVAIGLERISFMTTPDWFYTIYVGQEIWQNLGWSSILYLAALTSIDPELYAAAEVDGCGRFRKMAHVTLPGITPTIMILLILQIGKMMTLSFEKVLLLYNPSIYERADVISTFIYRKGLLELDYGYATAVGFFNSVINLILLVMANTISRRITESSLW